MNRQTTIFYSEGLINRIEQAGAELGQAQPELGW